MSAGHEQTARRRRPSGEWHRVGVGGAWDLIGPLQLEFMIRQGLLPSHELLDVGCGSLRGGVRFIGYLEPGHYVGVDKNPDLIEAGRTLELVRYGLVERNPTLVVMADFELSRLGRTFDYAIAQSLFPHLPLNLVIRCLMCVQSVLVDGGKFYATFFENPAGKRNLQPISHPTADLGPFTTYFDRDPYHYDLGTFEWICRDTDLRVEYFGDWGHPRSQKMLRFVKTCQRSRLESTS